MRLLAVDPGVRACGWALLEHGLDGGVHFFRLAGCGLVQDRGIQYKTDIPYFMDMAIILGRTPCERFVVETPQIYRASRQKGRQSDIARLLVLCGVLCGVRGYGEFVLPHDWKGSIPKPDKASDIEGYIVHRRNVEAFGKGYLPRAVPLGKAHNVADAVGLGLWRVRQLLTDTRP
jgi:hypothetical protein